MASDFHELFDQIQALENNIMHLYSETRRLEVSCDLTYNRKITLSNIRIACIDMLGKINEI